MPTAPFLAPDRDDTYVWGRAKRSGETYYCVPGVAIISTATASIGAINHDFYEPWYTSTTIVIDQLAIEATSALAATNVRIGFYRADRDWQPVGAPLADSGNLSTATTGVKTYTPGTPLVVRPGRYLSVRNYDSLSVDFRALKGVRPSAAIDSGISSTAIVRCMRVSRSFGAFPTPGTAWTIDDITATAPFDYCVVYRISKP